MTTPNPDGSSSSSNDRPRFRAGQLVLARIEGYLTEVETEAHAVILKLLGDVAHLAILGGGGHAQVTVDKLAPAKPEDVPNPLPTPAAEDSSGS